MNFWLFKSEPNTWSWDDQVKKGAVGEHWDGVRNYQASNNMKKMKVGDLGFFYHSVKERRIIGIVKVIKEYYPDHTDKKKIFGMVDLVAVKKFNELKGKRNTREYDLWFLKYGYSKGVPLTNNFKSKSLKNKKKINKTKKKKNKSVMRKLKSLFT